MRFSPYLAAAAAASLATAPAMAAPINPAASLSLGKSVRAGSPSKEADGLLGGGILAAIIIAGVIAGVVVIAVDNNDSPSSP